MSLGDVPWLASSTPSTHMLPLQAPLWQLLCHQHHSTLLGTAWHSVWHSMAQHSVAPWLHVPSCDLPPWGAGGPCSCPLVPPVLLPPCCGLAKPRLWPREDTCCWEACGDTPAAHRHLRGRGALPHRGPPPCPEALSGLDVPGVPTAWSTPVCTALPCSTAAAATTCLHVLTAPENISAAHSPPGQPHRTRVPLAAPGGRASAPLQHPWCLGSARPRAAPLGAAEGPARGL